jgi:hypothetical protein
MSVFARNAAHLERLFPGLSEEVLRPAKPPSDFHVVPAKSGAPTAVLNGVYLHSKHDPIREAERLVHHQLSAEGGSCVFLGFGLGYHVEAYLRHNPTGTAIVAEPDVQAFAAALQSRDMIRAFPAGRTSLLLGTSPEAIMQALERTGARRVEVFQLRSVYQRHANYFDRVGAVIRSYLSRREVNVNTLKRFGRLWIRNLARNLPILAHARRVHDLSDRFAGIPALLVAAGPSLDQVIPQLPELARRMLIIAVDTSLRACVTAGVSPDFLVVVDPQYWNTRHLDWHRPESCILVSESSTHPRVFRQVPGPVFFCSSLFPLGRFLEAPLGSFGKLGAGGSVSTTAWDFARVLGAAPIYCAGLDLGFPGKQTHFRGSFFEERVHTLSTRLASTDAFAYAALTDAEPYLVPSNDGGLVLTDKRLVIYQWWFENQMHIHPSATTFTLSEGGVRIDGMPFRHLQELLRLPPRRREIDARLQEAREAQPAAKGSPQIAANVSRLVEELVKLEQDAKHGVALATALEQRNTSEEQRAALVEKLDELDGRILSSVSKDVAGFLLQPFVNELLDEPHGRDAAAASRRLYHELAGSAGFHHHELSRGLQGLAVKVSGYTADSSSGATNRPFS